jgi:hypothetical protein
MSMRRRGRELRETRRILAGGRRVHRHGIVGAHAAAALVAAVLEVGHGSSPGRLRLGVVHTLRSFLATPQADGPLAGAAGLGRSTFSAGPVGPLPFRARLGQVPVGFAGGIQPRRPVDDAWAVSRTVQGEGLAIQTGSGALVAFDLLNHLVSIVPGAAESGRGRGGGLPQRRTFRARQTTQPGVTQGLSWAAIARPRGWCSTYLIASGCLSWTGLYRCRLRRPLPVARCPAQCSYCPKKCQASSRTVFRSPSADVGRVAECREARSPRSNFGASAGW